MDIVAKAVGETWSARGTPHLSSYQLICSRGEIFKITVFGQQIVFVGSVALCEEICDEKRFRKFVGGPIVEIRYSVHDSLFTAFEKEPSWGIHHRILAPLLSPTAVADHFTEIRDCALDLTANWRKASNPISAIDELNRLDLETTTLCFYGKKLNGLTGPEHPVIKAMDGATSEAVKRPTRPKLVNWLFHQSKFKKDTKTMRDYAAECLSHRKAHPTDRKDLLHAMINAKDPETGKGLTEQQIIDEIVTMPIGSSTAPCVISSAIYYLLKNRDCISRAREEIDSVIGDDIASFTYEHLDRLPYSAGIVRETLRLSAAAPGFNIEPLPDTKGPVTLGGGKYQVGPKQTMIVVLHGVNRDPAVFEEPDAFKPERMVGERFERLPAGAKKFFGNGKRVCIGRHHASMWCVIALVVLLKEVDFEAVDPGYELRQDGWFNVRPVEFFVKVKPRAA